MPLDAIGEKSLSRPEMQKKRIQLPGARSTGLTPGAVFMELARCNIKDTFDFKICLLFRLLAANPDLRPFNKPTLYSANGMTPVFPPVPCFGFTRS